MKRFDGCSACRCKAHHQREIFVPSEVLFPAAVTWMKQRSSHACNRIGGHCASRFVLITALATQRQILRGRLTTQIAWDNVVNRKRVCRISCLAVTVFAALPCSVRNQTAQINGNPFVRHAQGNEDRVDSLTLGEYYPAMRRVRPKRPYDSHGTLPFGPSVLSIPRIQPR
jgi:hypothetical protein